MSIEESITEVPLLDLNAQYDRIQDEVKEAIDRVLDSQYFIMGPEVELFEENIAEYCQADYAVGCASGSDALLLSLMAQDIGQGDAVITTSFTFFATAGAVARLGATPIFLDIDPSSYNIDPDQVKRFLEGNHPLNEKIDVTPDEVKAMIPVHLYGQMADMDAFMELGDKYDIKVIEDAAQAIGAEYKGKRAGSIGDFGCFSFFPSKNLGGYGDGGLVTTDDPEMAEKLKVLRLHGAKPKYHHSLVGVNSRLDAIQAAVLDVKLKHLDSWSDASREKALLYNRLFKEANLQGDPNQIICDGSCAKEGKSSCNFVKNPKKILTPKELHGDPDNDGRHVYHQYVIRTGAREEIMNAFDKKNIGYSVYYPVPMHEQECFQYLGYEPKDCPISSCASNTTLALPIYPELTGAQQQYVVDTIKEILNNI
ncbi:DegT/DnrJ/EryC1/StrS family aminotransferase [Fodinibius sp. AD559]|uniref:DegT/DnrJ/EryC1/StrS family aminotransferase n=1 Tax=Fodinibius sp. AD559 TaxID=3424179 RepID=UPI004046E30A